MVSGYWDSVCPSGARMSTPSEPNLTTNRQVQKQPEARVLCAVEQFTCSRRRPCSKISGSLIKKSRNIKKLNEGTATPSMHFTNKHSCSFRFLSLKLKIELLYKLEQLILPIQDQFGYV